MVNNCLIINLDERIDLWNNLEFFRDKWIEINKNVTRLKGVNYKNQMGVINNFIKKNKLNLNGNGFRKTKESLLGELGCFESHYNCWKYVVDNNLDSCLILEDGIEILRDDFDSISIHDELDILFINEEMKMDLNKNFIGYGTQGYIVTKKGAKKLIDKCYTLSAPIDLQMRHLCTTKELNGDVLSRPYVKRNNNRISSIEGTVVNNTEVNLNDKQSPHSIIQRILMNLLEKNINLDEYI